MHGASASSLPATFALDDSLAMAPELVSIAGIYRTSEVPLPDTIHNRPAQIRLDAGPDGDRLVIEALAA